MISHVELYVSDLARSADFWDWLLRLLGYQPFQSWAEGRSWRLNGFYLVLVQTPYAHVGAGYHRRRSGLNHLAFAADDRNQVNQVTEALRDRGVRILYEDRHPHAGGPDSYAVFFEDPDRIKVELVAP
jgi:catechol 2,3-dioxygenase-like lactoylglutathione lyase family enzyme